MKRFIFSLVLCLLVSGLYAGIPDASNTKRPKVALVLCGGGAKGAAHVGVLKVLEEAGLHVDMVVGTSIGGIIGGMYSMGYNAEKMDTIIRHLDWPYLLSNTTVRKDASFNIKMMDQIFLIKIPFYTITQNKEKGKEKGKSKELPETQLPAGFVNGQNILSLLTGLSGGYQDSIDFKNLPIPFTCIATDLATGEEVILDSGYLPAAMRATMAIPGFFSPVTIDGKVLVDGGTVNNFPTDVAKQLGADIIIGVDIQNDLFKADQLKSITQVFSQIIGLMGNTKYMENVKLADIYIKPDVEGFSTFSFNSEAIDSLITNGYIAALEKKPELEALAREIASYGKVTRKRIPPVATEIIKDTFKVATIEVKGVTPADAKWLLKKGHLKEGTYITGDQINRAISIFYGTNAFASVSYLMQNTGDKNGAKLVIYFKRGPANIFAVGARFDSEEAAALLLHLGLHTRDLFGSQLGITGRLSYNPYGRLDYSYVFKDFPKVNVSYMFKSTDMNIYERGELSNYMAFYSNKVEVSLSNRYLRNFDFQGGIRFESFNYRHFLSNSELSDVHLKAESYLSYFFNARMDDRDSKYFPKRGMAIDADVAFFLPGFNKDNSFFSTLKLNLAAAITPADRFSILPALYYRSFIGRTNYLPYINFAGGSEYGRYISQQIPFIGINYANVFKQNIIVGRIDLRGRIGKNHYIYGMVNYMRNGDKIEQMFNKYGLGYWGVGVKYAYDTPLGPMSLDCHWSDYNKKVGLYLNLGYYF